MDKKFLIAALLMIVPLSAVAEGHDWWMVDFSAAASDKPVSEVCVSVSNPDRYIHTRWGYNYSMIDYGDQEFRKYLHLDTLNFIVFASTKGICYEIAADFMAYRIKAKRELVQRIESGAINY